MPYVQKDCDMPMSFKNYSRGLSLDLNHLPQPLYAYSVGNTTLAAGEEVFTHGAKNTFVEIQWGVKGVGEVLFYDRRYEMHENDVFIWLPGEEHRIRGVSRQWSIRWLCFDGPLAEAILLAYRFPRHIRMTLPCPVDLFEEIAQSISIDDPYSLGHLAALIMEILARIRKNLPLQSGSLVERCMNYVIHHYRDTNLYIETLCKAFDVPRSTLTKLFYDQTKRPLGSYIRDVRYANALGLLRNTTLPIREIALCCGYASYPSFCRLVRRGTGVSPSEYRRQRAEVK